MKQTTYLIFGVKMKSHLSTETKWMVVSQNLLSVVNELGRMKTYQVQFWCS